MNCMKKIYFSNLLSMLLGITILLFFLYSFWFQNAFFSIDVFFTIIGMLLLVLSIFSVKIISNLLSFIPILLFLILLVISSIFFSIDSAFSLEFLISIVKYSLPLFAICLFVRNDLNKFKFVLWGLNFSIFLLCIATFVNPSIADTNAISIGTLNTNVLSSYLILQLMCCLFLLYFTKNKIGIVSLLSFIVLGFVTNFNAASRRGFLVYIFILIGAFSVFIYFKYKNNFIKKNGIILFMITSLVVFSVYLLNNSNSVIVERLLGSSDSIIGDRMRKVFQAAAIEVFNEHPIFGGGLGAVALRAGVYSHNLYTELLGCTGLIGLISLLIVLFAPAFKSLKLYLKNKSSKFSILLVFNIIFIVSILVSGYSMVFIYDMYFYIYIAVFISLNNVINMIIKEEACKDSSFNNSNVLSMNV